MPQEYIGSSLVKQLMAQGRGNTGPTGPIGPTGPTGAPGPTGATGSYLIGVSLIGNTLWNNFSNGFSLAASGTGRGITGPAIYLLDYKNLGTGFSLIRGVSNDGVPSLTIKPIKIVNATITPGNSKITVTAPSTVETTVPIVDSNTSKNITVFKNASNDIAGVTNAFTDTFVFSNLIQPVIFWPSTETSQHNSGWTGPYVSAVSGGLSLTTGAALVVRLKPVIPDNRGLLKNIVIDGTWAGSSGRISTININNPPTDSVGNHVLNIYVRNAQPTSSNSKINFRINSTNSIVWQNNLSPCLFDKSTGAGGNTLCNYLVTLYFINGQVLGTYRGVQSLIPLSNNCVLINSTKDLNSACNIVPPGGGERISGTVGREFEEIEFIQTDSANYGYTGACCEKDGTCTTRTASDCKGFFHGTGTTCGSTADFICNKKGACCVYNGFATTCFDELTCSECLEFNQVTGIVSRFSGTGLRCSEIDCTLNVFEGACCDGLGNCVITTEENCTANDGFYNGNFSTCFNKQSKSICAGSTGACCVDGNCEQLTFENCANANGIFAGYGKSCSNIECAENSICSERGSQRIIPGSEYGGGIVVGRFIPGSSEILGCSNFFSPTSYSFNKDASFKSSLFTTHREPEIGGLTLSCFEEDSGYLIIVYPYDVVTDEKYEVKNPFTQSYAYSKYKWGTKGYSSWGPIVSLGVYDDIKFGSNNYISEIVKYREGYWSTGSLGITQGNEPYLIKGTFNDCLSTIPYSQNGETKLFAKSHYAFNGNWSSSYGLYNTIRAISALKATKNGITGFAKLNNSIFEIIQKVNSGVTSAIQGITQNPEYLSDWYIPSHDELGFIAAKTLNTSSFNLNTVLIEKGYQPLFGRYWSSTGTFNYNNYEGVYSGLTAAPGPGQLAFSAEISENGLIEYYNVFKSDREQENKIRPIRLMRCDKLYPTNNKIWNLPKL